MKEILPLASSCARALVGGLGVLLPLAATDSRSFGSYATLLSVCIIGGFALDFGIGAKANATSHRNTRCLSGLSGLAATRDLIFCVIAAIALTIDREQAVVVVGALVTGSLISWQGLLRATKANATEAATHLISLAGMFWAHSYSLKHETLTANDLLLIYIVIPRGAAFVFCLTTILKAAFAISKTKSGITIARATAKRLGSFWTQSVFSSATSNLDVIIISHLATSEAAGLLKTITTVTNMAIVPMEVIYHYAINRNVNAKIQTASRLEDDRLKYILAACAFMVIMFGATRIDSLALSETSTIAIASLAIAINVLIKSFALKNATHLTIFGQQSRRTKIMLSSTGIYWIIASIAVPQYPSITGVTLTILASSSLQLLMYSIAKQTKNNEAN